MAIDFGVCHLGDHHFAYLWQIQSQSLLTFDLSWPKYSDDFWVGCGGGGIALQEGGLQSTGFVIDEIYIDDWDMDAKERDDILGAIWERVEIYTREPHRREGTTFPLRNIRRAHLCLYRCARARPPPPLGRASDSFRIAPTRSIHD